MNYHGRVVDPIALWSEYVEFPSNLGDQDHGEFLPLVVCPNPEHGSTKRHFQINVQKPLVHCFAGCGISGTYEHAISMIEGCTHRAARRAILKHSRIGKVTRKKSQGKKEIEPASLEYQTYIPQAGLDYMTGRGFSYTTLSDWGVGWNPETLRVVIPARDNKGRLKFLIERAVKPRQEPRYLYTEGADKNRLVFGLDRINPGLIRSWGILLVEGSLDAMMMRQHGFATTVALLTSRMSRFQARQIASLRPKRIFTMFDADVAGIEATISTYERLPMFPIKVCRFPKGKTDPAQLTRREAERSIERAISFGRFQQLTGSIARPQRQRKEIRVGTH